MLTHPTFEKLQALRLAGMARAFEDQQRLPEIGSLSFEERLGLLVDREMTDRENRRLKTRLRQARLRQPAALEDIDFRHPRGLDKIPDRSTEFLPLGGSAPQYSHYRPHRMR